jgi:acetyl esterase/lipase
MSEFESAAVPGEGRRPLEVDVFRPAANPNGVAVVLLHGGGWARGHRSMVHGYARTLAARGFVTLAAEYRLLPEAPWPAQLEDVRDVVRWTKTNASALAIDPAKIALQGFSAGAHLALLVGGTQPGSGNEHRLGASATGTEVAAIVSFFAPAKLDANPAAVSQPPFSLLLNGGGIEAARAASPIYYVHRSFPSTFILGGMADYMQPLNSGLGLLQVFVEVGAEVEFHYFHSQTHEFSSTPGMLSDVMDEVAFFYRRTLLEREALAVEAREQNIFARARNPQEFAALVGG